jgi:hypothetical protein
MKGVSCSWLFHKCKYLIKGGKNISARQGISGYLEFPSRGWLLPRKKSRIRSRKHLAVRGDCSRPGSFSLTYLILLYPC